MEGIGVGQCLFEQFVPMLVKRALMYTNTVGVVGGRYRHTHRMGHDFDSWCRALHEVVVEFVMQHFEQYKVQKHLLRSVGGQAKVRHRGMLWFHLPIADVSTPDEGFEQNWALAGDALHTLLRNGRDVLVHCRGGLGCAGTIAARLLVEIGVEPSVAVRRVRAVRPGAIETRGQERYVLGVRVNM